jgi:hypothetical protein
MSVVVADIGDKNSFEVPAVHDQDPVDALGAYGADPTFDERIRARRPYRCADRPDAFGAEHLIERGRELAVAVVDQKRIGTGRSTNVAMLFPGVLGSPTHRLGSR